MKLREVKMLYNTIYFTFMLFKTIFCLEFLGVIISSSFVSTFIAIITALSSNISNAINILLICVIAFSLIGLILLFFSSFKKSRYKLKNL
jgi:hypothetical protein